MPKVVRPPPPANLLPYPGVVDTAILHGWKVELTWDKAGWRLEIRDREELVARGRSRQPVPSCFRQMGSEVKKALEKSGRLR